MPSNFETRYLSVRPECRAEAEGKPVIIGHAAVFNELSEDLGGFRERIVPGAFARAIEEEQDVVANVNHDDSRLLGRTRSGTLTLREDERGLLARIALPNTTTGDEIAELVARGDISQMSFRFRVANAGEVWTFDGDIPIRTIGDVDLYDVSLVTFPAYPQTDASIAQRSMAAAMATPPLDDDTIERRRRFYEARKNALTS